MKNDNKTINQLLDKIERLNTKISLQEKDISVYKQTIVKTQDENKITNMALDTQLDTFFLFDPIISKAVQWNKSFTKISGYTDDEIAKLPAPASYYSPEDLERAGKFIQNILKGNSGNIELELICKDGQKIPFEYQVVAINDEKGEPKNLISIGRNITKRKETEEALREKTETISAIVESSPMGMHMYSLKPDGKLIFIGANPAADTLLGVDNNQFIGKTIEQAFPPLAKTEIPEKYRLVAGKGESWQTEQIIYKDEKISGAFEVIAFQTSPGNMVALFLDITERKQAEEALKSSEKRFKILFGAAPDAYYLSDLKGTFIDGNKAAEDLMGYKNEELIEKSFLKLKILSAEGILKASKALMKSVQGKGTGPDEFILNRKDGSQVPVEIRTYPVKIDDETVVLGIARDITERKQAKDVLAIQRQRLADILEGTNAGTWDWNVQTGELTLNERWAEIIGYTLKELEPIDVNTWINNVHTDDLPIANALLNKNFNRETNYYDVVFRQPHKDGRWVWINARGKVIEWTDDDKPLRMSGIHIDITNRKQAEEKLKSRNKELETWAEVTTGRELFMLNLKKEINELLVKSGEKPKYKIPI